MPDLRGIKRNRLKDGILGQETINQIEHIRDAGARLVMGDALVAGDVVTTDSSAAPILVFMGSVMRIQVVADTYVAFADDPALPPIDVAVTVASTPALKLPAGYHIVVATGDFMRTSSALTRLEIINLVNP